MLSMQIFESIDNAPDQLIRWHLSLLCSTLSGLITSKDMVLRSRHRLDRIKTRLASLLDTAAQLSSVKSQVDAVEENQGSETHREDSDYSGVGQSASQITTDIAGLRSKLTRAIASMNTALQAEALKRKETGRDVGKQLEGAIARMERVQEVSCKLVQKSFCV